GDISGLAEWARDIFANGDESNRRCGLFPVGGTAGASGMIALLGVRLTDESPGPLYGGVYHVAGSEEPWTENGAFIEIEYWNRKSADSLPEMFAEWEQEAIYRTGRG
ncbi:MAG: hypothetical protein K2V38_18610, partial [Gemmataceae bacterium]|nr:hypothetical protein [Gemmataceae bacterium]